MESEMADFSEYSAEYILRLRDYYVQNDVSMEELARVSGSEFGHAISFYNLKKVAAAGRWTTLKRRASYGKEGLPENIADEVSDLRQIVYDAIMNPEEPLSARDLSSLISAFSNLKGISRDGDTSAKTDLQSVLEELERQDATK